MKKTIVLALILVLVVGFYFLFLHNSGGTSVNPSEIEFSINDTSSVTMIKMQKVIREQAGEQVVLDKRPDGAWMINGKYMAQRPKVTNLLKTLNLLQLKKNLSKEGKTVALERLKTHHIMVTISGKEGILKEYFIGATNKEQTGNIMMLKDKDVPYIISRGDIEGYVSIYYSTDLNTWRENLIFNIPLIDLKRVSVAYSNRQNSFTLFREAPENEFDIQGEVRADSAKVEQYLMAFKGKSFAESFAEEFYPNMVDSLLRRPADIRFYYEMFDGYTDTLNLYLRPENKNNFFGYLNSRKELLTVQHFVFDKFLWKKPFFELPTL